MCWWIPCFHIWCHSLFWWCTVHVLAGSRRRRHSLMFVVHSFDVSASPLAKEVRAKLSLFFSPLLSYPLSTYPTNQSNTNNKPFIICSHLNRHRESRLAFETALSLDPEYLQAHYQLAVETYALRRHAKALQGLQNLRQIVLKAPEEGRPALGKWARWRLGGREGGGVWVYL